MLVVDYRMGDHAPSKGSAPDLTLWVRAGPGTEAEAGRRLANGRLDGHNALDRTGTGRGERRIW